MKKQKYTPIILAAMTIAILAIIIVFTWFIPSRETKPIAHAQPTPQPVANTEQVIAVVTALAGTPTRIPAPLTTETIDAQATLVQKWQPGREGTVPAGMIEVLQTFEAGDMVPPDQYYETQTALVPTPVHVHIDPEDIPSLDPGLQTMIAGGPPPTPDMTEQAIQERRSHAQYETSGDTYVALVTAIPLDSETNALLKSFNESTDQYRCVITWYKGVQKTQIVGEGWYWQYGGGNQVGDYVLPEFDSEQIPTGGLFIPDDIYIVPADSGFITCFKRSRSN